ncbi:DUF185-domain-containing protein [Durotheca rogersii]|uniref:DUF185-domain-containing protein n=1 Tax=Durotheca rogersii TaxID=419775 RepID=UPI00221EFB91|nr:DUF185-domain-containing protein [Durotheca rogersii]KAI5865889.1 DUF185-domain-containing protein [Durotheca rogersii]
MDSLVVSSVLRRLFRHPACQSRRNLATLSSCLQHSRRRATQRQHHHQHHQHPPRRTMATRDTLRGAKRGTAATESGWQQRTSVITLDMSGEYKTYPTVTANDLRSHRDRPRRVKMLMRDFIEDSLYNPHYGYFSKQAVIFSPGEPFDFNALADEPAFHAELARRYTEFEDALDARAGAPDLTRQLWHTPTELFRPYYGEAVARYLLSNYVMSTYPYHDLIIYEMGAGRGTLMLNVLDYIRDVEPAVYDRTKYKIIEISSSLAALQTQQLRQSGASSSSSSSSSAAAGSPSDAAAAARARGHADKVEIINKSIFDWDAPVPSPCFFLAMEVFDNFAHDVLRYDLVTEEPLQGVVLIDAAGDFHEFYEPALDPVAARYLRVRHAATGGAYPLPYGPSSPSRFACSSSSSSSSSSLSSSLSSPPPPSPLAARLAALSTLSWRLLRRLRAALPFAPNLSGPEYVPTRLMQFFDVLERRFPAHRLVAADFAALPGAVRGLGGPVVQTRYARRTVPVSTPLVHQGYFDILFPTDFRVVEALYRALTGKLTRRFSHEAFVRSWAYVDDTRTRSGENPLLSWYRNANVLVTV